MEFNIQRFANKVPEAITAWRVYSNGKDDWIGAKSIEIGGLSTKTVDVSGIGLMGEVSAPIEGQFESIETTINWNVPTEKSLELIGGSAASLECYADIQFWDASKSEHEHQQLKITIKGRCKNYEGGTIEAMNTTDASTTIETTYLKYELGGKEKLEIDKYNSVFKINGVDKQSTIRKNIGIN